MPEVFLASSAIKKFDGLQTIVEAKKYNFDGVQLFLDPRYWDDEYFKDVVTALVHDHLGLVLHLPNIPNEQDLQVADCLAAVFPESRTLIHYLPATQLPVLKHTKVGWENSVTGIQDETHIEKVFSCSRSDETFFVFDVGRPLYAKDDDHRQQDDIINFICSIISKLSKRDLVHLADKQTWSGKFRDEMCALGQGVCAALLPDLRAFKGTIVLEHEDLQMAVASLAVLR